MKETSKEKIIEEIIILRTKNGYSSTSLVTYLKTKHGYEQSRAYDLIREARELMGEIYNQINVDVLKDSILFMENLKEKLLGIGDTKGAMDVQKELNKVNQLYVQKIEIEAKNIEGITINIKKNDEEK